MRTFRSPDKRTSKRPYPVIGDTQPVQGRHPSSVPPSTLRQNVLIKRSKRETLPSKRASRSRRCAAPGRAVVLCPASVRCSRPTGKIDCPWDSTLDIELLSHSLGPLQLRVEPSPTYLLPVRCTFCYVIAIYLLSQCVKGPKQHARRNRVVLPRDGTCAIGATPVALCPGFKGFLPGTPAC